MTASSTARVRCDRPGRFARSLASRYATAAHAEWDGDLGRGHLVFAGDLRGEVDMIAGDGILLLHLQCATEGLDELEELIGTGVVDIAAASVEGTGLEVEWKRAGGQPGTRWATA